MIIEIDLSKLGDSFLLHRSISDLEKKMLEHYWMETKGNQTAMASILGLHRQTLKNKLLRFGIEQKTPKKEIYRLERAKVLEAGRKKCGSCGSNFELKHFNKNKRMADGFSVCCKYCLKERYG